MSEEIVFKKKVPKAGLRRRVIENKDEQKIGTFGDGENESSQISTTNINNGTESCESGASNLGILNDSIAKSNNNKKDDNEDEDEFGIDLRKLEELKELRELKRKQAQGLSAERLSDKKGMSPSVNVSSSTSSRNKVGLTTADALASDLDLGKTFSVETNRRDEDADMLKFIEEELAKRRGKETKQEDEQQMKMSGNLIDLVFNVLPEHLLKNNEKRNEEMLSNQMLSGIPEVDLGVNERIRNIEATELAKQKIIRHGGNRTSDKETTTAPNSLSANYVQLNKFNMGDSNVMRPTANKKPRIEQPVAKVVVEPVVVIGDQPKESSFKVKPAPGQHSLKFPGREKPTDDFFFERFKKSFRK